MQLLHLLLPLSLDVVCVCVCVCACVRHVCVCMCVALFHDNIITFRAIIIIIIATSVKIQGELKINQNGPGYYSNTKEYV